MNKKTAFFLIAAVALGFAGFFVYQNLGGWARTEAQRIATDAAGVEVSIGGINVLFKDKTVMINNVKVANPKGFDAAYAITLGNIKATAETLTRDKIVLKEVVASGEIINLESNLDKINLKELQKGIQARSAKKKPSASEIKTPKVIIKQFRIEQGELNSAITFLGKKNESKLTIPTIKMYNLGEGKATNNADEVAAKIIQEILTKALQTASSQGLLSSGGIKGATQGFKDSVKGMKDNLFKKN